MLGLSRIFAALTISCSVTNSLSRPLAMVPPPFMTGAGFCASSALRQRECPFRNAGIGGKLGPTNTRRKHGKPVGGDTQERHGGYPRKTHQRFHRRRDRRRRPPPAAEPRPVQ